MDASVQRDAMAPAKERQGPEAAGIQAAAEAGLRYVSDTARGMTRRRRGTGFSYHRPDGGLIDSKQERARIEALAIPPAWQDVWIAPWPNGHIQATGRDQKGRKQYIYHPEWIRLRDEDKFGRMLAFGRALPAIRAKVDRDMRRSDLSRERVVAAVVRLLETSLIRVGNQSYARDNKSYGLTTLRARHLDLEGDRLRFCFVGKGGREIDVALRDRRVARVIRRIQDLPGQELFQYLDEEGGRHAVLSEHVNAYLRSATGEDFSAKDFRTFAATVLTAWMLHEFEKVDSQAAAKRNVTRAIEQVARRLGNTTTVCRQSYVHPEVVSAYLDGSLLETLGALIDRSLQDDLPGLEPEEAAVLAMLRNRLTGEIAERA